MSMSLPELTQAALNSAVMVRLPVRTQLEVTGTDRASFLHNFCTNHIKGLTTGRGCEAFLTNIKGRILFHAVIYAGEGSLWIETDAGYGPALIAHLDRYLITEDVQLHDRSEALRQVYLCGPQVGTHLSTALGVDSSNMIEPGQVPFRSGMIRRFSYGSSPGLSIVLPTEEIDTVVAELRSTGVTEAPSSLFETLRIEGMFPLSGVDLTEDNLAQEGHRTSRAISFAKGCYLGQEPIARLDALGHVNRLLCGVISDHPADLPAGTEVFADDQATRPAGILTSTAVWPPTGQVIGLGVLRREISASGTACYLGSDRVPARIRPWPVD